MANRNSTVMARIEPEIKEQAEKILAQLGVTSSGLINMLYRQIILTNGIPFSVTVPKPPFSLEDMLPEAFDAELQEGYRQSLEDKGASLEDVFAELERGLHGAV